MQFLDHVITSAGIQVDSAKVEAVVSWQKLRNATKIHNFLGLAGYYRRFIQNFSSVVAPLTWLTRKGVSFQWSEECESSFQDLKSRLTSVPVLTIPVGITSFSVYTNTLGTGLGAVLMQDDRIVAYSSRQLKKHE